MTAHRHAWRALVTAGIVALAPAVWGLAELVPDKVGDDARPDYMVHPLGVSPTVRTIITIGATALVAAAAIAVVRAVRRHDVRREWVGVLLPLAAVAGAAGLVYSVVTAPVIGANIGGGLAVMAGVPFGLAMMLLAAVRSVRIWRSPAR